jgi:hypothetical protein
MQLISIENPMSLETLQTILGSTVSYGIRGKRATLKNNDLTISNNKTLNLVIVNKIHLAVSSMYLLPALVDLISCIIA